MNVPQSSGLSQWLGDSFGFLEGQNNVLVALVICFMVACLTEVASNTASTTLLMPILAPMVIIILISCGTKVTNSTIHIHKDND